MTHIITLPKKEVIKKVLSEKHGMSVRRWGMKHGFGPTITNIVVDRYSGKRNERARIWGEETWRVIEALSEAVSK